MKTCLYLGHFNPITNAHVEIIKELQKESKVVVMPVRFLKNGKEVMAKSFPFNFEIRKKMLDSVFKDSIVVSTDYTFEAPFVRYFPPILSPISWKLRNKIKSGVSGEYFTYTGDKAEEKMLKSYRLKPKIGKRKELSASSVKEKMYDSVKGIKNSWEDDLPKSVVEIINENSDVVSNFAAQEDLITKVLGMKFPKDGFWSK